MEPTSQVIYKSDSQMAPYKSETALAKTTEYQRQYKPWLLMKSMPEAPLKEDKSSGSGKRKVKRQLLMINNKSVTLVWKVVLLSIFTNKYKGGAGGGVQIQIGSNSGSFAESFFFFFFEIGSVMAVVYPDRLLHCEVSFFFFDSYKYMYINWHFCGSKRNFCIRIYASLCIFPDPWSGFLASIDSVEMLSSSFKLWYFHFLDYVYRLHFR